MQRLLPIVLLVVVSCASPRPRPPEPTGAVCAIGLDETAVLNQVRSVFESLPGRFEGVAPDRPGFVFVHPPRRVVLEVSAAAPAVAAREASAGRVLDATGSRTTILQRARVTPVTTVVLVPDGHRVCVTSETRVRGDVPPSFALEARRVNDHMRAQWARLSILSSRLPADDARTELAAADAENSFLEIRAEERLLARKREVQQEVHEPIAARLEQRMLAAQRP